MTLSSSTIVIGVTGGVGAGKSSAQKICSSSGYNTVDVDDYVHDILDSSKSVNSAILQRFKLDFNSLPLMENGSIDRKALAQKAFKFPEFRLFLENLIHPLVKNLVTKWIISQKSNNVSCAFVFIPLLFESDMDKLFDATINISASVENRSMRLINSRGWTPSDVYARINAQLNDDIRCKRADYVVFNNSSIENLEINLKKIINCIISSLREK